MNLCEWGEETIRRNTRWIATNVFRFEAFTRIRSLNVTVGTGIPYGFGVWGDNLDSSIAYDNGALVDDEVTYTADSEFLFTLTEDVTMTTNFSLSTRSAGGIPYTLYLDGPSSDYSEVML
ncbi:MAG: hypothetical protein ACFFCP_14350 [Promethearchaeota archaeon]